MTRYVDHATDGTPVGRCVVLPGRQYSADAPLLYFAAEVALARGWDVRQVWWDPPARGSGTDEAGWVGEQLEAALADAPDRVLVVAKSLGTLAAGAAADRHLEAAWLTPLLADPAAAAPLLSYPAAQLVVIGTEDPFLDRAVIGALPGTQLLVPGDHVLRVPGDPHATLASHALVVRALDSWLDTLPR